MVDVTLTSSWKVGTRSAALNAHELAARMARLALEARLISANISVGLHGRRRAGQGENFWQYRSLAAGEPNTGIDWRRSARHAEQLYIREREWEAAHSVYIFIDRSASMQFRSTLARVAKDEAAIILGLALADCLVKAGERVALLGITRPMAHAYIIDRFADALMETPDNEQAMPRQISLPARAECVIISDGLDEIVNFETTLDAIQSHGASAHVLRILDPVEELFPFEGETELLGVENQDRLVIGDADKFAERYRAAFRAHAEALSHAAQMKGASFITHRTDRSATDALQAITMRIIERHPKFRTVLR